MRKCLNCGAEVPKGAQICGNCGLNPSIKNIELPEKKPEKPAKTTWFYTAKESGPKTCTKCGQEYTEDFCPNCGVRASVQAMTDLPGQGMGRQGVRLHEEKKREAESKKCKDCKTVYYGDICPKCGEHPSVQAMTDMEGFKRPKKE